MVTKIKKIHYLYGVCALILLVIRIPSFFGPQFSSDEGFYLSIGHSLQSGLLLYRDIWDNKPPLLYIIYGLNSLLFGNTIIFLRILGFALSLFCIALIDNISKTIFDFTERQRVVLLGITTLFYSFYFELTLFNAENIFVPLVLAGFLFFWKSFASNTVDDIHSKNLIVSLTSGICLALASWTKLNTLPEIAILLASTLIIGYRSYAIKNNKDGAVLNTVFNYARSITPRLVVAGLPTLVLWLSSILFFSLNNALAEFIEGIIGFSGSYLNYSAQTPALLGVPIGFISHVLINASLLTLFFIYISYIYLKTRVVETRDTTFYLIISWFAVTVFALFLSSRGYPHYFQQIIPPLMITLVMVYSGINLNMSLTSLATRTIAPIIILNFVLNSFTNGSGVYNWFGLTTYYGGFVRSINGTQTYDEWNASFDENGWSNRTNVETLISLTKHSDRIYFVGSSPEVYADTKSIPGYRLIVDYHIDPNSIQQVIHSLKTNKTTDVYISSTSGIAAEFEAQLESSNFNKEKELKTGNSSLFHYVATY